MGNEKSEADTCLNYNWNHDGLTVCLSWIDDNLLTGKEKCDWKGEGEMK